MASGKRASMREGPLAALFRKTDEAGAEPEEAPVEDRATSQVAPRDDARQTGRPHPGLVRGRASPRTRTTSRGSRRRRSACATRSPRTSPRT